MAQKLVCDGCRRARYRRQMFWRCRGCGVRCCGHRCSLKHEGTALCGECRIRTGQWDI